MFYQKWFLYHPDGGAPAGDGGGANTGVDAGTPGPQLEDLGVPAEKAEKFRQRKKTAPKPQARNEASSAADAAASPEEEGSKAMSWDEFMKIPENNERMQRTMSERVNRVARENAEYMEKLSPALKLLADRYKIQPNEDGSYDAEAITKAVTDDDSYYEEKAADLGVDVETAKKIDRLEAENRRNEELARKQQREQQLRQHFMQMQRQANDVKDIMPGFDLQQAIQDPVFLRLTSPEVGMSVKQAVYALHGDEIQAQTVNAVAQRAKLDVANAIRSGVRPRENGNGSAAATATPDMHKMTREDRRAYIMQKYAPPDR
jgi:hypothetical protein